jgi:hypothetical protein
MPFNKGNETRNLEDKNLTIHIGWNLKRPGYTLQVFRYAFKKLVFREDFKTLEDAEKKAEEILYGNLL